MIRPALHLHSCVWLVLMLALSLGCQGSGGDVNVVLEPPAVDTGSPSPAGHWTTTTTEILDTCGFEPLPSTTDPLLIEEAGSSLVFTFSDQLGRCEASVRERSGDFVTLSRTDTVAACGGSVLVQSRIVYEFTAEGFAGTAEHFYSNLSASCANLPCEYRLAVAGSRCEGCWPGCVQAASIGGAAPAGTNELRGPTRPRS